MSPDAGHIDHAIIFLTTPFIFPRAPHAQLHHIRSSAPDPRGFQLGWSSLHMRSSHHFRLSARTILSSADSRGFQLDRLSARLVINLADYQLERIFIASSMSPASKFRCVTY